MTVYGSGGPPHPAFPLNTGSQVSNWVNQSAQAIPALQPLNPGAGGPIQGQQVPFHSDNPNRPYVGPIVHAAPALPGGAPATALPAGPITAVPPQAVAPTPAAVTPDPLRVKPLDDVAPVNPYSGGFHQSRHAAIMQHLMRQRGYQTSAVMPNPTPV